MEQKLFLRGLRDSLVTSGLGKDKAAKYTFHAWRHFYTTYMRGKVEDKLLQSQTGHLTIEMLERYSEHVIQSDRDKIRDALTDVFSSLLPITKDFY